VPYYDPKHLHVVYDAATIEARNRELGAQITADYRGRGELVLVGVLRGSFPFIADLCRFIDLPVEVDFLGLSSYGSRTESSGIVRMTQDLSEPVKGKHVLVVEDIVDTGLTMKYLLANLQTREPESVRIVSLLHKPDGMQVEVPIDYVGFTIPNQFVVGYGLDFAGKLRNLPFIGVVVGDKPIP